MRSSSSRCVASAVGSLLLLAALAGPALAHSQVVQPPALDAPVISGPISNAWAQAHCHAQSPVIVADASNGVVEFRPGAALPCPLLIVTGTRDRAWPRERYNDLWLTADYLSVDGASHWGLVLQRRALGSMLPAVLR